VVSTEALLRSRDKRSALQYLAANDIPVPDSVFMAMPDNVDSALGVLGNIYPVIIKMLHGTQGDGVLLGENKGSAKSLVTSFLRLKEEVLLQRFIKESNGKDIRVFIVGGEVVATMERTAQPGEFRSNLHRGAEARKIKITDVEKDIALRAADLMGLKVAGVDILRSETGPMVLEVNASPGLEGIEKTTKVDVAGHIIKLIESHAGAKPL
jgi:ribosomal protein S6--L-glutamate ligase